MCKNQVTLIYPFQGKVVCADDGYVYMDPWNHDLHAVIYHKFLNVEIGTAAKSGLGASWSLHLSVLKFNIWKGKTEDEREKIVASLFFIYAIIK